nr:MAG TPA: chaperone [Caudoviricetes sp.]
MDDLTVQFVKLMAQLNADITNYVVLGAITPEQYKEFTGKDYVQPATQQPQA